jgi:transcriptional regulator with XRE-family HTH domain
MVGDGALGTRLRAARAVRGMSLRTVAAEAGISASLLSQVENGRTQP